MTVTAEVDYEIDEGVVILPEDSRLIGNCNKGARAWFRRRGLDWARFVSEGLPAGEFGTFDEAVREAYEAALKRTGR
ncbi:MAG: hypothetical protein LBW85_08545 [Deltaproteobacteria bacterium]|jgi:hypothetical protein|nr:hypothetical protein [Deltaproteobacteria bacterium]